MTELSKHGAESTNLPEEPLVNLNLLLGVSGQELAGLLSEVEQDGSALKDGDGFAIGSVGIDQSRDFVVGLFQGEEG